MELEMTASPQDDQLRARLIAETGRIAWHELQPHFARGALIRVARDVDLIDVAMHMARDDRAAFERWLCKGSVARASDQDARGWTQRPTVFWAVVVAPWVLIQEIEEPASIN